MCSMCRLVSESENFSDSTKLEHICSHDSPRTLSTSIVWQETFTYIEKIKKEKQSSPQLCYKERLFFFAVLGNCVNLSRATQLRAFLFEFDGRWNKFKVNIQHCKSFTLWWLHAIVKKWSKCFFCLQFKYPDSETWKFLNYFCLPLLNTTLLDCDHGLKYFSHKRKWLNFTIEIFQSVAIEFLKLNVIFDESSWFWNDWQIWI